MSEEARPLTVAELQLLLSTQDPDAQVLIWGAGYSDDANHPVNAIDSVPGSDYVFLLAHSEAIL